MAARAVVFGLLAAFIALVIVVLVSVGLVRLLDVYVFGGRVWISYLILGLLFTALRRLRLEPAGQRLTGRLNAP